MICSFASAANKGYSVKSVAVVDEQGVAIPASEIRSITIYNAGTFTASTIYADKNGGALTNPVLTSNAYYRNGGVQFWSAAPTFDCLVKTTTGGVRAVGLVGANTIVVPKSKGVIVIKRFTLGAVGATGTDMVFTTAANTTAQVVNTGAVVPPFARILNVGVICTTAATFSGGGTTLVATVGTSATGTELAANAATMYAANTVIDVNSIVTTPVTSSASATTIYVKATPGANWSTMTGGAWTVLVAYIDEETYR